MCMPNEVLIYGGINKYSVAQFIRDINDVSGDTLTVRVDTDGGDPQAAFGMISKFNEFEGDKLVRVDGRAHSSGLFFVTSVANVECLDTSRFGIHRASYGKWYEESEYFTDVQKKELAAINKSLRKSFEAKVDVKAFEKISTHTVEEIFSMEARHEFVLSAAQAKKIGLVKKVNKMTPIIKAEILSAKVKMAAFFEEPKNQDTMTPEEFKKKNPEAYAQIEAEAKVKAEADAKIEAEVRAKVEAEIKAKKEAEAAEKAKKETEASKEGDAEAKLKAEIEAKVRAELKIEAEKAKIEAESDEGVQTESVKTAVASLEAKIDAELEANGLLTPKK